MLGQYEAAAQYYKRAFSMDGKDLKAREGYERMKQKLQK
jgi:hypothetical protein